MKKVVSCLLILLICYAAILPVSGSQVEPEPGDILGIRQYAAYLMKKEYDYEVIVAVVDSGVAPIDILNGRTVAGYDFVNNDSDASDDYSASGHGTFIAGQIAGVTHGLPVKIMPVKVAADTDASVDSVADGIRFATDNGADIINLSVSGISSDCEKIDSAVEYAFSKGITVVACAGNGATLIDEYCPAHNECAITVSMTDNEGNFVDAYSNYGRYVDVCAPGLAISGYDVNNGIHKLSGTSMSAAFISAGAALVKLDNPSYVNTRIEEKIKSVCKDLGEDGFDNYYGYGMPDFRGLIDCKLSISDYENSNGRKVLPGSYITFFAESDNLPEGSEITWYVNGDKIETGEECKVEFQKNTEIYCESSDYLGRLVRSEIQSVKVRSGLFGRIAAFFAKLFRISTEYEQKARND